MSNALPTILGVLPPATGQAPEFKAKRWVMEWTGSTLQTPGITAPKDGEGLGGL